VDTADPLLADTGRYPFTPGSTVELRCRSMIVLQSGY
jgi:hypothetical protein